MKPLIALDPGITTGISFLVYNRFSSTQLDTTRISVMYDYLLSMKPSGILYEDFKFRPNMMKAETHSIKVIAMAELYAEWHNIPIVFKCLPAEAKAFWKDDKIKKLGLWIPGKGHAMDALRVMLTYKSKSDIAWEKETILRLR